MPSEPWRRPGLRILRDVEYSASRIAQPNDFAHELAIQSVDDDVAWGEVVERRIELLCQGTHRDLQASYERDKFENYRGLVQRGLGDWYVARLKGIEVGDMGIFVVDESLARFQEVLVYPGFRNAGVCRSMVFRCCQEISSRYVVDSFVTVADRLSPAGGAYDSVGLRPSGIQAQAYRTVHFS
jgi:hypothetical protein